MSVRVGIVGFGFAGRILHAPLIRASGMQISAIVTSRPTEVGNDFRDVAVFNSIAAMLDSGTADLAVIATPNHLHVEQASAALAAGCHVVIDKPPAVHSSQLEPLIEIAVHRNAKVAVFHNRRWDSDFLTLKRLSRTQTLGEINAFHMRWDRFRPKVVARWREQRGGGGVLLDLGSHMIDQVLQLFGRPDWVQASVFAQRQGAVVDDGVEILMAKGELVVTLGISSLAAAPTNRYIVHGSRGSFVKSGLDVQEQQLRDGLDPRDVEFGREPLDQMGTLIPASGGFAKTEEGATGCWIEFYHLMRRSIEHRSPVPVSLEEARDVMLILEAALASSNAGRRVHLRP
jgi:scyllo-inositol 2-dehydrogenase (NADP+)